jgi:hypothetical protein
MRGTDPDISESAGSKQEAATAPLPDDPDDVGAQFPDFAPGPTEGLHEPFAASLSPAEEVVADAPASPSDEAPDAVFLLQRHGWESSLSFLSVVAGTLGLWCYREEGTHKRQSDPSSTNWTARQV